MFTNAPPAPLRGSSTPEKPFGYYDATIDGGWQVPGEPYTQGQDRPDELREELGVDTGLQDRCEQDGPQEVGESLDTLARVHDQTFTANQIACVPKRDEGIVVDAVVPVARAADDTDDE